GRRHLRQVAAKKAQATGQQKAAAIEREMLRARKSHRADPADNEKPSAPIVSRRRGCVEVRSPTPVSCCHFRGESRKTPSARCPTICGVVSSSPRVAHG